MQWHAQVFRELWKLVTSVQTLVKLSSQQIYRIPPPPAYLRGAMQLLPDMAGHLGSYE